jgi:hypothetical protein
MPQAGAMQITLRDRFEVGADAFWRDVFFDGPFLERLYREALGADSFEILSQTGDLASGMSRRLRFSQKVAESAAVRKLFGETASMEEEGRYDPASGTWTFHLVPGTMPDKVTIRGKTWLEPQGADAVTRVSELSFSVSIFAVGGLVEKYMASQTKETVEKQTRFIREYLAARRA